VVLADPKDVDARLLSEDGLVHDVPDDLGVAHRRVARIERDVAEGVDAEL